MSKAQELANEFRAQYDGQAPLFSLVTLLEQYGGLVQEAAAAAILALTPEGWPNPKSEKEPYCTGVSDGVKVSAKAIREMPLP